MLNIYIEGGLKIIRPSPQILRTIKRSQTKEGFITDLMAYP
jgi:hypothetical protein